MGTPPFPFEPGRHLHFSPLKRLQVVSDSDGHPYKILVQAEEMSCGMAAAVMVAHLYHNGTTMLPEMEARYKQLGSKFPGSLVESDKLWSKGAQTGAYTNNIVALLNSIGVPTHTIAGPAGGPLIPDTRLLIHPAVFLWGWYPTGQSGGRAGGHFNVAARVTSKGKIVILDPWDGRLSEVTPGENYKGTGILEFALQT